MQHVRTHYKNALRQLAVFLSSFRCAVLNLLFRVMSHRGTISASRLVIIAPHPDDETFACGGLIARMEQEGKHVSVIFMTNGEASHDACCKHRRLEVAASREAAAHRANRALGLASEHLHWLALPDTAVPSAASPDFSSAVAKAVQVLRAVNAQAIVYPHRMDMHPDHVNTSSIAICAADMLNIRQRYSFPTWMRRRLQAKHLVQRISATTIKLDIREVLSIKNEAIGIYMNDIQAGCPSNIPSAGNIEHQLLKLFQADYEIFFDESLPSGR